MLILPSAVISSDAERTQSSLKTVRKILCSIVPSVVSRRLCYDRYVEDGRVRTRTWTRTRSHGYVVDSRSRVAYVSYVRSVYASSRPTNDNVPATYDCSPVRSLT